MELHALTIDTADAQERGRLVGARFAPQLQATTARYLVHFDALGIGRETVRDIVDASRSALRSWSPALAEESDAMALAAGVRARDLAAVGARTEVLAAAPGIGECTTAVHVPPGGGAPQTIQTWDWYDSLAPEGLLLGLTTPGGRRVKLFTEFGTAAKIGVNDAGLGLHFNILRHDSDNAAGGVPVHAVGRRILEEASTLAEAVDIARSAQVSASTVLTVATFHAGVAQAASIELAPAGLAVVAPATDGWLIHTNHFLDPALAAGEAGAPESVSVERFEHAHGVRTAMVGVSARERAAAFCGGAGEAAVVCMRPDDALPAHEQWGTLLTISLDVAGFGLDHLAASPDRAALDGLDRF